jgi:membrane associated rhomboid family serine protease
MPLAARTSQSTFGGGGGHRGPPIWRTRYWSVTIWIVVITSAISLLDMFLLRALSQFGSLSLADIRHGFIWQLFTYQLLHGGPFHLLINMFWLYFLGPIIEPILGKQRFLMLYILSGLTGGAAFLLTQTFAIGGVESDAQLVGASGSILGVMAAAVCVAPRLPIRLWFPPIAIELWIVFLIAIAIALLAVRTSGDNAGGEAAHLGGAAAGLVAFKFRSALRAPGRAKRSKFWKPGDSASKFFRNVD